MIAATEEELRKGIIEYLCGEIAFFHGLPKKGFRHARYVPPGATINSSVDSEPENVNGQYFGTTNPSPGSPVSADQYSIQPEDSHSGSTVKRGKSSAKSASPSSDMESLTIDSPDIGCQLIEDMRKTCTWRTSSKFILLAPLRSAESAVDHMFRGQRDVAAILNEAVSLCADRATMISRRSLG